MVGISDNIRGLVLAISSSIFIGSSFIIKKKGLKKAGASGTRAGDGGHAYLKEPWWWVGMITMIVGEGANFIAYAFAPAILVTPLGALSIIFSAVLAHFILDEKLHPFGVVGCILCLVGSVAIVLHAPLEKDIESVKQVWHLATEPGFVIYTCTVLSLAAILIYWFVPRYGQTHMVVYIGICSLTGSLTVCPFPTTLLFVVELSWSRQLLSLPFCPFHMQVMGVKAVGIALKLSFSGSNQFIFFETWFFTIYVIIFCIMQLNYLNKALDIFNTAVVSPVYYVMFTTLTILASMIMFKEWDSQTASQIVTELCGFVTILCGTFLLHKTKDMGGSPMVSSPVFHPSNRELSSRHADI
ncbi:probable magnesium transporter NIPA1 isoform X1 [Primulina eburnea]|uniref:probable magnesium transporter NIPA1 isoform X1 n=1 Tax=Primulina eburnea TaxID=1245227 RepID=UPI003C6CAC18